MAVGSLANATTESSRPLRIGLVSDCYVPRLGGIEMQVHDLAVRLQHEGHEVVVITPTPGPSEVDNIRVLRMDVPLLPFDVPYKPSSFRSVIRQLEAERVDVAHFNGGIVSPLAFVSAAGAVRREIPSVITIHCMWSYAVPGFRFLNRVAHWEEWPAVLSAVSEVAAKPIKRVAKDREIVILPNGIANDQWVVEPLPRDPSVVTVVSVMRLAPRKRPINLLRMIRRVHESLPPGLAVQLKVIGEGPERSSMEQYIETHHLRGVVELCGRLDRDQIRSTFATADFFVAPANLESFGIAALEARCAGLPVVAKSRTGIREFVENGQEGLLADTDHDMADQIRRLVTDADLREKITTFNREVPSPVDWSEVVHLNIAAYHQAIELMAEHTGSAAAVRAQVVGATTAAD